MEVQINFKLSVTDIKHYNFLKYKNLLYNSKIKIFTFTMLALLILIPIIEYISDKEINYSWLLLSFLFIILYFFFPYISSIGLKYYFKRDKFLQEQRRFTINDNELLFETDISSIHFNFDKIVRIIEDKHIFAILIGINRGFVLPKRVLNHNELLQIIELFIKKIPEDKLKLQDKINK